MTEKDATTHRISGGVCPAAVGMGEHVAKGERRVIYLGVWGGWICANCRSVFFPTDAVPWDGEKK